MNPPFPVLAFGDTLLAQEGAGGGIAQLLTLFLPLIVLFYFLVLRPQRRQQEARVQMLSNLKKNDHVVTIGGLHGTIVQVKRETDRVTLKVDETGNTRIDFDLSAVARVVTDAESAGDTS